MGQSGSTEEDKDEEGIDDETLDAAIDKVTGRITSRGREAMTQEQRKALCELADALEAKQVCADAQDELNQGKFGKKLYACDKCGITSKHNNKCNGCRLVRYGKNNKAFFMSYGKKYYL